MNRRTALLGAAGIPFARPAAAWAQGGGGGDWSPDRPVRMIIPFAAGTTTDTLGRIIAQALRRGLGQAVVVDNRTGAGGTVGAAAVAQAAPDGTTILFGTSGAMATNPVLMPSIPYDPIRDFAPIASVARTAIVLGVRPALGPASVEEFLALARRRTLSLASAGTGTTGHIAQALLDLRTGITTTHVPYREGNRAVTDLIAGVVDAMFYHPLGFLPHIRSGAIRPLALTGEARSFVLPEVPTMAEAGVPGVIVEGWWAIYAPAATPAPVVARLNALVNAALRDEAVANALRGQGLETMGGTPEALRAHNAAELERQREVVRAAGITAG
jgi:tripartite-type tricarboxylate transporter receptor subunit TctC